MRADKIIEHEDWQHLPFLKFLGWVALKNGVALPGSEVAGEVKAEVNHGRWVVQCPELGCGGAMVVSSRVPVFYCPFCGNPSNAHRLYGVIFPAQKAAIEIALLKRPLVARLPSTRNWVPGETVADLRKENNVRGID